MSPEVKAYVIEHRWARESWRELRPVFTELGEALVRAERMAAEVPARSAVRVGYEVRVRSVDGAIYGTYRHRDDGPFGDAEPDGAVTVPLSPEAAAALGIRSVTSGRPQVSEAADALELGLGVARPGGQDR